MRRTLHVPVVGQVPHPGEEERRTIQGQEIQDDKRRQQQHLQVCHLAQEMVAQRRQQNSKLALGVAYWSQNRYLQWSLGLFVLSLGRTRFACA